MSIISSIKDRFLKGAGKLGMTREITNVTDHPLIAQPLSEEQRIRDNKLFYANQFENVMYLASDGSYQERDFHSLNVPKIISRKLSKLVFNEGVAISVSDESANEFIEDVFEYNGFNRVFGEELEGGYAVSGLCIKPVFDSVRGAIKFVYASADNFFSLSGNTTSIEEACIRTLYQKVEGDRVIYYTLLEFHLKVPNGYKIINELYRSESSDIVGNLVPLTALEQTAELSPEVTLEGFTKPLFVYIKLAGKNNISYGSPLGLGVIDNAKRQIIDINEKYDEFMQEIAESQRKIIASDHFFKVRYDKNGKPIRRFESKTGVYQSLKMDEPSITEFSPSLRSAEFIESINFILRIIEIQSGFSAGTFSFDGQSVKTATEVVSENTETYQTRQDNVLIVTVALKDLVQSILQLASAYGIYNGTLDVEVNIDFDDGIFQSKEAKLEYNTMAMGAGIMSKVTAMISQYGMTEEEAKAELAQINAEMVEANPFMVQQSIENDLIGAPEGNSEVINVTTDELE